MPKPTYKLTPLFYRGNKSPPHTFYKSGNFRTVNYSFFLMDKFIQNQTDKQMIFLLLFLL